MLLEELKTYDWEEAFSYADFSREDVKNIIAADEGYNDGDSWLIVVELNNGKYGFLSAWCDYTGWDCQSGGTSEVKDTLEELQRWCLASRDRRRLNMVLEDLDN